MSQDTEPHRELNTAHVNAMLQETVDEYNSSPEPLYRLRLSVLKDGEGSRDIPLRMFTFPSHASLQSGVTSLKDVFGGAFSEYTIRTEGVLDGQNGEGIEDGRTEDILIKFDSQTADESWREFEGRMDKVKKDWNEENLGVKTMRGAGVRA